MTKPTHHELARCASEHEHFADTNGSSSSQQLDTSVAAAAPKDASQVEDDASQRSESESEDDEDDDESFDESDNGAAHEQRMQDMYRSISPQTYPSRDDFTYDDEDITKMNAHEQELLVGIQELQCQLSIVQIQTEKSQEEILWWTRRP